MKSKASLLLKQMLSVLSAIAKAKSMAIKNKTSAAKARLIMFSLVKGKKFFLLGGSISNKIHGILGQHEKEDQQEDNTNGDQSKAIVLYNEASSSSACCPHDSYGYGYGYGYDDDDKYPDLRHSLFDEDDEFDDQGGSIIDIVRNSKEEEGQDFSLEDEIDHVADLFIKRFHKQMRMQKLESFKRYQEMLARGV